MVGEYTRGQIANGQGRSSLKTSSSFQDMESGVPISSAAASPRGACRQESRTLRSRRMGPLRQHGTFLQHANADPLPPEIIAQDLDRSLGTGPSGGLPSISLPRGQK